MRTFSNKNIFIPLACLISFLISMACQIGTATEQTARSPQVLLQRLGVAFMGQDGHKIIGSGCPGTDGKGTIEDYHLIVSGVDEYRSVKRILVAGDNSTLTWERPCSNNWALSANNLGNGNWEIFIAPSLPSRMYTVIFFYDDDTLALGMALVSDR